MKIRSARLPVYDVNRLTRAEKLMLEEYAKTRSLPVVAKNLGLTKGCVQIRGKSIREKMDVESLDAALEKFYGDSDDGQPDEMKEWQDYDPDC